MRIAIGSDHAGFDLKEEAKAFLLEENHEVLDVGTYSKAPVDYPDYAEAVATALREYRAERGKNNKILNHRRVEQKTRQ
jgi:RpiB/LacA/LacB family sugar-phosphate isomerase